MTVNSVFDRSSPFDPETPEARLNLTKEGFRLGTAPGIIGGPQKRIGR